MTKAGIGLLAAGVLWAHPAAGAQRWQIAAYSKGVKVEINTATWNLSGNRRSAWIRYESHEHGSRSDALLGDKTLVVRHEFDCAASKSRPVREVIYSGNSIETNTRDPDATWVKPIPASFEESLLAIVCGRRTLGYTDDGARFVFMHITRQGEYVFSPLSVSIPQGTPLLFILLSGAPHNISFQDVTSAEAAAAIEDGLHPKHAYLTSEMLMNHADAALLQTSALPLGSYEFVCTPHLALGMVGRLIVTPATTQSKRSGDAAERSARKRVDGSHR